MLRCNYIKYDEEDLLATVIKEKKEPRKTQLVNAQDTILERYDAYLTNFPSMEGVPKSAFAGSDMEPTRRALEHCYDTMTKTFKGVRGKIFSNQSNIIKSLCPYCMLNWPDTLDHYIGKTEFPEYSILCKNLIPCCSQCNQDKNDVWRNGGLRQYIHFYNDEDIFEHRFLYARLVHIIGEVTPKIDFYLSKPEAMASQSFQVVKRHFEGLGLLSKYSQRSIGIVSSLYDAAEKHSVAHTPVETFRQFLVTQHEVITGQYCQNYFQAVIYETFANDKVFLARLYNRDNC